MPIIGITDREPSDRAFVQIGTIRKGGPKGDNRPGKDLDHFRVEFLPGEEEAAEAFKLAYPTDEPRELNVVLPFDDVDRMWETWQEAYKAGALVHRCDGEHVQYSLHPETGEVEVLNGRHVHTGERIVCNGRPIYHYKNRNGQDVPVYCKPAGRLRVIIPELRRLAYLLVVTGSIHDIINLSQQLRALKTINSGRLAGIPLVLKRRPRKISTPSGTNGQRARREKWLLSIEADPTWVDLKLKELGVAALPALQNGQDLYIEAPNIIIEAEPDDYTGGYDDDEFDEEPPIEAELPSNDSPVPPDVNPDLEALSFNGQDSFHHAVMEAIPYYKDTRHIVNYLTKELGQGWGQKFTKTALFEMLKEHAIEKGWQPEP